MDIKSGMDVSSFVLVEESADSEVDSLTCEMCLRDAVMATGDEDDAESCSCDTIEIQAEGLDYDHVIRMKNSTMMVMDRQLINTVG